MYNMHVNWTLCPRLHLYYFAIYHAISLSNHQWWFVKLDTSVRGCFLHCTCFSKVSKPVYLSELSVLTFEISLCQESGQTFVSIPSILISMTNPLHAQKSKIFMGRQHCITNYCKWVSLSLSWYLLRGGMCEKLWSSFFSSSFKIFFKMLFTPPTQWQMHLTFPVASASLLCLVKVAWPDP